MYILHFPHQKCTSHDEVLDADRRAPASPSKCIPLRYAREARERERKRKRVREKKRGPSDEKQIFVRYTQESRRVKWDKGKSKIRNALLWGTPEVCVCQKQRNVKQTESSRGMLDFRLQKELGKSSALRLFPHILEHSTCEDNANKLRRNHAWEYDPYYMQIKPYDRAIFTQITYCIFSVPHLAVTNKNCLQHYDRKKAKQGNFL